jgi:hypothetical protein
MKYIFSTLFCTVFAIMVIAQTNTIDTVEKGNVTIIKDNRLDELVKIEANFNKNFASNIKSAKGFRLMVISSNDRNLVMNLRSQLLQLYPDQKAYMSFQPPYIKLKFGNFLDKSTADEVKKEIIKRKLVSGNIYVIPETIEVKLDKNKDKEKDKDNK